MHSHRKAMHVALAVPPVVRLPACWPQSLQGLPHLSCGPTPCIVSCDICRRVQLMWWEVSLGVPPQLQLQRRLLTWGLASQLPPPPEEPPATPRGLVGPYHHFVIQGCVSVCTYCLGTGLSAAPSPEMLCKEHHTQGLMYKGL